MGRGKGAGAAATKRRPPARRQTEAANRAASPPSNGVHSRQTGARRSNRVSSSMEDAANENATTPPRSLPQHTENHQDNAQDGEDEDTTPRSDDDDPQSDAEDRLGRDSSGRTLRSHSQAGRSTTTTPNPQNTGPEPQGGPSSGARRPTNSTQHVSNVFQAQELRTQARSNRRLDSLRGPSVSAFTSVPEQPSRSLIQPLPPQLLSQLTAALTGSPAASSLVLGTPSMSLSATRQASPAPPSGALPISRETSIGPISRSASVVPPETRKRTPEDNIDSEASKEAERKAKKKKHNDARARLSHFSDNAQLRDVLELAMTFMKLEVSTVCPYPAADLRTRIVDECFDRALQKRELPLGHFILDKGQQRMILAEEGGMRSAIKKAIKPRVATHYGLINGPSTQQALKNKERAQFLLSESRFHFKDPDSKQGWFRNAFIADAVIASWFSHSNALGALYQEYFNPIRLESLALILAIIHHCLSQWAETGSCKEYDLPPGLWTTYDDFLAALKNYEKWSTSSATKLTEYRVRLFKRGLWHSGAKEEVQSRVPVIEISDEAMEAEMRWQENQDEEDEEDIE